VGSFRSDPSNLLHIFLTSGLAGGEWSASRTDGFTAGERVPDSHWTGGWVDPRAGLDDVGFHIKERKLDKFIDKQRA
jgi:hypothetical protein